MAIGVSTAANIVLKIILKALVEFEGPETFSSKYTGVAVRLFVTFLFNTALLVVILNANTSYFSDSSHSMIKQYHVLGGDFGDFDTSWYFSIGTALTYTMLINCFSLQLPKAVAVFVNDILLWVDRNLGSDRSITVSYSQKALENLHLGPEFQFDLSYAIFLNTFFICLMFSAGIPFLNFVGTLTFGLMYSVDKFTFLRLNRRPPLMDASLASVTSTLIPFGVCNHLLMSIWMFSNSMLFEHKSPDTLPEDPYTMTVTDDGGNTR